MANNKVVEWSNTIVNRTGFDKFVTMNVISVVTGLTIWIILYNVIPNKPSEPEEICLKTKSTKSKKENV